MKEWLEKIKTVKAWPWLMILLLCAVAFLLLPLLPAAQDGMTEEERRVSATLSQISGAGETRISIYYAASASAFGASAAQPLGAVIVSRGAEDVAVRLNLMRAAEALLGLNQSQIEVFPMEEKP